MAGLENLIELIRTTNEVYFITAPQRLRAAFILVDDVSELALKTFLQSNTMQQRVNCQVQLENDEFVSSNTHRNRLNDYFQEDITFDNLIQQLGVNGQQAINNLQTILNNFDALQHWSANRPDRMVTMDIIINEARNLLRNNADALDILTRIQDRHQERNVLYHDHQRVGWEVGDRRCLAGMCDLFDLLEHLFPNEFLILLHENQFNTVRCQLGVLRLKYQAADGQQELTRLYNDALSQMERDHQYRVNDRAAEHSILHNVSVAFFTALRAQFNDEIAKIQLRINDLTRFLERQNRRDHRLELNEKQRLLDLYISELNQIESLFGP